MFPLLKHRFTWRITATVIFEIIALYISFAGLIYFRAFYRDNPVDGLSVPLFALCCTAVVQFAFWSCGLYSRQMVYCGRSVLQNLLGAFLLLSFLLFPVCYAFSLTEEPFFKMTQRFYLIFLAVFMLVVTVERFIVLRIFNQRGYLGNILVLGTGDCTRLMIKEARKHHGATLQIVGILGETKDQVGTQIDGIGVIGTVGELQAVIQEQRVKTILLSLPWDNPDLPLDALLEAKLAGLTVYDACSFYETVAQKVFLEKLDIFSVLYPGGYTMTRFRWWVKEIFEKILALVLIAVLLIPALLVMLLIWLTSSGPVVYAQKRVGKNGKIFTLYKLRTMVNDAEAATGATWARKKDHRITGLGRLLRKTRFDEVPQLINILKGDMAFVGPRPERPVFVDEFRKTIPFYHHRHFVKPGLTGWAQVAFTYAAGKEQTTEKLRYDLYYVKNMSLFFDWMIMLSTLRTVLFGGGGQ